jgi:hypothetical protein
MPKKITLILMISILVSGISVAEEEIKDGDYCAAFHEIAKSIMLQRQDGTSIAEMMGRFSEDNKINELARTFILEAYKLPKWDIDKLKVKAVDDFANNVALGCYANSLETTNNTTSK